MRAGHQRHRHSWWGGSYWKSSCIPATLWMVWEFLPLWLTAKTWGERGDAALTEGWKLDPLAHNPSWTKSLCGLWACSQVVPNNRQSCCELIIPNDVVWQLLSMDVLAENGGIWHLKQVCEVAVKGFYLDGSLSSLNSLNACGVNRLVRQMGDNVHQ